MADEKILETELRHYALLKEQLLKHNEGKFALIIGEDLLGTFDTSEAAYAHGVGQRGNVPMLIKRITKEEPVISIPALTLGLINAHF